MFDILRSKKKSDIETQSIDRLYNRNIFVEKSCWKCAPKANPRPAFNVGKKPKTAIACKKCL